MGVDGQEKGKVMLEKHIFQVGEDVSRRRFVAKSLSFRKLHYCIPNGHLAREIPDCGKTGDSPPNRGPVSGKGDMISIRAGSHWWSTSGGVAARWRRRIRYNAKDEQASEQTGGEARRNTAATGGVRRSRTWDKRSCPTCGDALARFGAGSLNLYSEAYTGGSDPFEVLKLQEVK